MSTRVADDFAAIRARLRELRRTPAEIAARADADGKPDAAKERYPRDFMDAIKGLLHELARR